MKKVIIWGHKLHSHTHSYIHGAFYKAFMHMGYETYWFDNKDDVSTFNFNDCLFITEGQVDSNIPLNKTSKYVLHNCDLNRYHNLNYLQLQVFTNGKEKSLGVSGTKLSNCIYFDESNKILYQPWATDLLPDEIVDKYIPILNKKVIWVGSIWCGYHGNDSELLPFIEKAKENNFDIEIYQPGSCSFDDNYQKVKSAELAPAIVGKWQKINGYIPCRIFKNISYGKLGLTNSKTVYDFLESNVIYSDTSNNIIDLYLSMSKDKQEQLFLQSIKLIKNEHTYLNRSKTILNLL